MKQLLLILLFLLLPIPATAGQVYLKCTFKDPFYGHSESEEVAIDPETNEAYLSTAIYYGNPQVQATPLVSSEKYTLKFTYEGKKYVYEISRLDGTYSAFEPSKMTGSLSGIGGYLTAQEESVHHTGICEKVNQQDVPKQLF